MIELNDDSIQNKISNYNDVNSFLSRLLYKFSEREYEKSRKMFYGSLSNFSRFFDFEFLTNCTYHQFLFSESNNPKSAAHILAHKKFCSDLFEFSRLIFRQNKKRFEYSSSMCYGESYLQEMGYARIVDFKTLYIKHEADLAYLSSTYNPSDLFDYICHVIFLFGGLWRNESLEIFLDTLESTDNVESKFYKMQFELSMCMTSFGVFKPPHIIEIILPKTDDVPHTKEEVLKIDKKT
ncbi:MAG: hypothetical protein Q4P17_03895 [Methanobacterium sp.]|nr:hypothetical protein [Methanobacterium sp.]